MTDRTDEYDTTSLRENSYGMRIHRDYLAHVFRWGWAARYIGENAARRVLEPGCGSDAPLVQVLERPPGVNKKPEYYLGLDLGPISHIKRRRENTKASKMLELRERFNFVERYGELVAEHGQTFDLAVSFEVIEHMTEAHGDTYLRGINALMPIGGTLLISTPVFNGSAAANHIREYTVDELEEKLQRAGFAPKARYGTFASFNDIKRALNERGDDAARLMDMYMHAREFYSDDVLACFLAPLFPDHSRNNAWVRTKVEDTQ